MDDDTDDDPSKVSNSLNRDNMLVGTTHSNHARTRLREQSLLIYLACRRPACVSIVSTNRFLLTLDLFSVGRALTIAKTVNTSPIYGMLESTQERSSSSISNRSLKLFTLSGVYSATRSLLNGLEFSSIEARISLASEFWNYVSGFFPEWQLAKERKASPAELRRDFIHAHTLALSSLARVGNQLLAKNRRAWKSKLQKLDSLDWSRSNPQWEGRAMNAGRLSKKTVNVALCANLIKKHLGLKLTADEQQLEKDFRRERRDKGKAA